MTRTKAVRYFFMYWTFTNYLLSAYIGAQLLVHFKWTPLETQNSK
jgi:hypothetical protein